VRAEETRLRTSYRDSAGMGGKLSGIWSPQGLEADEARRDRGGTMHRRALDGADGITGNGSGPEVQNDGIR
jgi:hypothetical protein